MLSIKKIRKSGNLDIRILGNQGIRFFLFIIIFINSLFVISNSSFALDLPRFYGEEIVVTATRLPQLKIESPWSVDVLKEADLKGKVNLGSALREVAGIDIKSSGYLGSVVSARLRGSSSQQVLVLIDGQRINSPLLGMVDLGDILLGNVEKIEIARAPLSSLYGTDAIGGVINVITKNEGKSMSVAYGLNNTQKFNFDLDGTSIAFIMTDGLRQNSDYTAQNISQKLSWKDLLCGNIEARIIYYNADKGVPGISLSDSNPSSSATPNDRQKDRNLFTNVSLENNNGPLTSKAKISYSQLNQQTHLYDFIAKAFVDSEYKTKQGILEASQVLELSKRSNISYGVELKQDNGQSLYAGDHTINNYAAYGQVQLGQKLFNLTVGSRFDKHSVFGYAISPRAGISVLPSDDLTLRASIGSAFKAPTLNDLYWNDPVYMMYGDVNMKPEKSQTSELGIEKKFGDLKLAFNYYYSSITDLILWDWNMLTNVTLAKNVGAVDVRGGELEGKYQINPAISIFANYTFQKSEDSKDLTPSNIGKLIPYSPEKKYNIGINILDNIRITSLYVGERFVDAGNTVKLPEYNIVNVWAGHDFGRYNVSLSIDNLFNQVYYESMGYNPATFAQGKYPMPQRQIAISVGGQI